MHKFFLFFLLLLGACVVNENYTNDFEESEENDGEVIVQTNDVRLDIENYKQKVVKYSELNKWNTSKMDVRWQEYKGTMVKVQILLGDTDLHEMRLKLVQNSLGTDIDGDNKTVLGKVADFEMKRVCGRNVKTIALVYDNPSFETIRPNAFFDYRITNSGTTMREYGFRCIYK